MKKIVFILTIALLLSSCNSGVGQINGSDKLHVSASIYPWGFFAEQIGGDLVEVRTLVPVGVEAHEYDPSPEDLKSLYNADLFIYNGANLEPWIEDIELDLRQDGISLLSAADHVELIPIDDTSEEDHKESTEESFIPTASAHETGKSHAEYDPHFWQDPVRVQMVVQSIANTFANLDSANADVYLTNAKVIKNTLAKIDEEFSTDLKTCTKREFISSHAAFAYLSDRYNLTMISISGLSPEDEPTIKELEAISKIIKEHDLSTVYTETLLNTNFASTIGAETGSQLLVLNPLEGLTKSDLELGENFFTIFKKNLANLKIGLDCEGSIIP